MGFSILVGTGWDWDRGFFRLGGTFWDSGQVSVQLNQSTCPKVGLQGRGPEIGGLRNWSSLELTYVLFDSKHCQNMPRMVLKRIYSLSRLKVSVLDYSSIILDLDQKAHPSMHGAHNSLDDRRITVCVCVSLSLSRAQNVPIARPLMNLNGDM